MVQFLSSRPKSKCLICGKDILVRSTRGKDATGFCSRVCASRSRYDKRFTGSRSEVYSKSLNLGK